MPNSLKGKKTIVLDKLLILLAIICITFAVLLMALYLNNAEVSIFANSAYQMKENYTSTESNTWDVSENQDGSVIATLDENGLLTIEGTGAMKDYRHSNPGWNSVKDEIKTLIIKNGVTSIGESAFYNCESLIKIEIPSSITSIGESAFDRCSNLTRIEIPSSVSSVGYSPFYGCGSLESITVDENNANYMDDQGVLYTKDGNKIIKYPEGKEGDEYEILSGVTSLEEYAFYNCDSLIKIEIPSGVTNIGNHVFANCRSLTSLKIPDSVTSIGEWSLSSCVTLTSIKIPSSVTSIGGHAFYCCKSLTRIDIPSGVVSIEYQAFEGCNFLESITVDENNANYMDDQGVLYTKDESEIIKYPEGKKLDEYEILSGVTSIGKYAFYACDRLTRIGIPDSVISIGDGAFSHCDSLTTVEIPDSVTSIGYIAFSNTKIINLIDTTNNIDLPNVLKRTRDENDILYSSNGFELTNCTIENNNIKIEDKDYTAKVKVVSGKLSGLTYLVYNNTWDISKNEDGSVIGVLSDDGKLIISGLGEMKDWNLADVPDWHSVPNKVENIIIENGVTNIGACAFVLCEKMISIEIPSSVTSIGGQAFLGCSALTEIEIPETVTSIQSYAFSYCSNLRTIKVNENNQNYYDDNGVLYTKDKTEIIKYPEGKQEETYTILSETTSIESYAFSRCSNLKEVTILQGINDIKEWAFEDSKNLIIICKNNTVVQAYAQDNNIKYISTNYDLQKEYIKVTKLGITYEQFINDIVTNMEYSLKQEDEIIENTTIIKTGQTLKIGDNSYTIVITGDSTGDGHADLKDILAINKHRLNKANLTAEYLQAGDVNEDGTVDIKDILQINKFRLGKTETL